MPSLPEPVREVRAYYGRVWGDARGRTWDFLKEHVAVELAFLLIAYVIGVMASSDTPATTGLLFPLGAAATLLLGSLGWNLISAPVRLEQAEATDRSTSERSLVGRFADLIQRGEGLQGQLAGNRVPMQLVQESFNDWDKEVYRFLREEMPECAFWIADPIGLREMPAPSIGGPSRALLLWMLETRLTRLRDIEAMALARRKEGHPDGPERTRALLLKRRLLIHQQHAHDLRIDFNPPPFGGGDEPPDIINDRLGKWSDQLTKTARDGLPQAEADWLLEEEWNSDQLTTRDGVELGLARRLHAQNLRLGELLGRLDSVRVRPGYEDED